MRWRTNGGDDEISEESECPRAWLPAAYVVSKNWTLPMHATQVWVGDGAPAAGIEGVPKAEAMRRKFRAVEPFRNGGNEMLSSNRGDRFGLFQVGPMRIIVSDGLEADGSPFGGVLWEHVSVSFIDRTPTWDEMCQVKSWFWDDDEPVIQIHPRAADYVNYHPYCLHLWRTPDQPTPDPIMVGPR